MARRGASGQPVKGGRTYKAKARRTPIPQICSDPGEQVAALTRELKEAREQQAATAEVLKVISRSTFDLQTVLDTLAESAARLCEAYDSIIYLRHGELLRVSAHYGPVPLDRSDTAGAKQGLPLGRGWVSGRAFIDRVPVHINDLQAFTDEFPDGSKLARTILAVPLLRQNEAIGVLTIRHLEVKPFTDAQVELVTTFADQAVIAIGNARLLNELGESLQQQTATADILKVISSSRGDLKPVFESVLENATRLCDAKFGTLFLYDGESFRFAADVGAPREYTEFQSRRGSFKTNPGTQLGQVLATKRVTHTADYSVEPFIGPSAKVAGARSSVSVPMLKDEKFVGAIQIFRLEVRPFTNKQIALLENFAAQGVIAIENARLLSEVRESLQQQTATADVLKTISRSTFDLQVVLDTLVESAAHLCRAEQSAIRLLKNDLYHHVAAHGISQDFHDRMQREPLAPGRGSMTGRVVLEDKSVHIIDGQTDSDAELANRSRSGNVHTILGVPLLREGAPIGVLVLQRSIVQSFTGKEIELAETFADQAVIAIENVRLFDEVQARTRELSESLQQQTATSEVLKVISSSPGELEPVFHSMLENATRICEAKFGNLFLREGDGYRAAAVHGEPSYVEYWRRAPFASLRDAPLLNRVTLAKKVIHVPDLRLDQSYLDGNPRIVTLVDSAGARTFVIVPMLKEHEIVGTIAMYRTEVRPYTDKQIELVQNFAAQAVIAIENTRLLNELRESLQQQTATADVLKVISTSPSDTQPVFDAIVQSALKLFPDALISLALRYSDRIDAAAVAARDPERAESWRRTISRTPLSREYMHGAALLDCRVVDVPDARTAPAEFAAGAQNFLTSGNRAITITPMMRRNEAIGLLTVVRRTPGPLSDKQFSLLRTFAAQAVIAIENTRLLNELRESLQQQTATADVLKTISRSTFDLQTVLHTLVESAARLCDADKATITRQKDGDTFYRAESYGFSREFMNYVRDIPIQVQRGSASGRALLEGKIVHIHDVKADPEYTFVEAQRLGDFRSILAVPMLREEVPVGVLTLTRAEVRPFTDRQIELVSIFADQAAIAIENVRLFENVEARTRELAKSLEDLRTTQDRLVQTQKLALLGQLTAGIAHEIKNPLNFVNNFSGISAEMIDELREVLGDVNLTEKQRNEVSELMGTLRSNFDKVVQHGKRADAIVKNMLQHSREGSAEHRVIDINALVEESLNLAWHGARAETQDFEIKLKQSFDPSAGEADLFPQDIRRALLNVISNGFYAATKRRAETDGGDYEPTLTASTKNLGDRVEITIRDNGTGITPDVKEKIFNPFFTTKPTGEGTGLGLSISHDIIVKQHAGSIEIDTQPGEFTEIRVILPRVPALLPERP
jgi:GAF domain-containing protein